MKIFCRTSRANAHNGRRANAHTTRATYRLTNLVVSEVHAERERERERERFPKSTEREREREREREPIGPTIVFTSSLIRIRSRHRRG